MMPDPSPASVWISTTDGPTLLMTETISSCSAAACGLTASEGPAAAGVGVGTTATAIAVELADAVWLAFACDLGGTTPATTRAANMTTRRPTMPNATGTRRSLRAGAG